MFTLSALVCPGSSCEVRPALDWSGPPQAVGTPDKLAVPTILTTADTEDEILYSDTSFIDEIYMIRGINVIVKSLTSSSSSV